MKDLLPWLAIPAGLLYAAGLLLLIMNVLSRLGGWHGLAKRHRVDALPPGETFHMQSATFGLFTNYNNVLSVVITPEGVALRPFVLFRLAHPPLLLPWSELTEVEPFTFLWARGVSLRADGTRIRIYRRAGEAILAAWQGWAGNHPPRSA